MARLGLRYAALAALAVVVASLHLRQRPATLCVLRDVTGIPCPFCGGTTSLSALGSGDVVAAFRASLIAPLMLVLAPMLGLVRLPVGLRPRWRRWSLVLAVLAVAEVWQLARFGLL